MPATQVSHAFSKNLNNFNYELWWSCMKSYWKEMICEKLRAEKAWPHQKALCLLKQYMEDNMLIHIYQIQI